MRKTHHSIDIKKISAELEQAQYAIWIAASWYQHPEIYPILLKKARSGVNVEIVLEKEEIYVYDQALSLKNFAQAGGEIFFVAQKEPSTFMRDKFCIIDYETVITGSYQWLRHSSSYFGNVSINKKLSIFNRRMAEKYFALKRISTGNRYS